MTPSTFRLVLLISCAHALVHTFELALPSVEQMIGDALEVLGTTGTPLLPLVIQPSPPRVELLVVRLQLHQQVEIGLTIRGVGGGHEGGVGTEALPRGAQEFQVRPGPNLDLDLLVALCERRSRFLHELGGARLNAQG